MVVDLTSAVVPNAAVDDGVYLPHVGHIEFQPVFIIGPHRSGTSILYRVLGQTGVFNQPTVFDVLNWRRLLWLNEHDAIGVMGVNDRGYDLLPVEADSPVEYQVAFSTSTPRPVVTDDHIQEFHTFCRKLTFLKGPDRPLLLKNPYDAKHFLFLQRHLPNSRFLFIHRDPAAVISSQIKAINAVLTEKNEFEALLVERYRRLFENPLKLWLGRLVYSERLPYLFWRVAWSHAKVCDYTVTYRAVLGDRALDITYADLCRDPAAVVSRVLMFLRLAGPAPRDYTRMMRPRELPLHPRVAKNLAAINRRNRRFRAAFGV